MELTQSDEFIKAINGEKVYTYYFDVFWDVKANMITLSPTRSEKESMAECGITGYRNGDSWHLRVKETSASAAMKKAKLRLAAHIGALAQRVMDAEADDPSTHMGSEGTKFPGYEWVDEVFSA
jgi:hypothetical protein